MLANRWLNIFLFLFLFCFIEMSILRADEKTQDSTKKTSTQQVGGLLFDVDEGVKIEKGAGGSVYMKSNKEYMQEKFASIDKRIEDLENRVGKIEAQKKKAKKDDAVESSTEDSTHNKVLVS